MKKKYFIPGSIVILIIVTLFIFYNGNVEMSQDEELENGIKITEDGTKYLINPDKLVGGGPRKGGIGKDAGIPALAKENINFVSVSEADKWIQNNELVLALEYDGVKRVYPLQVMTWHEIANDVINGKAIAVTYCPLCGSGIAYERQVEVDGVKKDTRFGTSGKLYNSNLVMYDEETDSYWSQIDGQAIIGELTGQELKSISVDTVVWGDWKANNPDSEVLSKETGFKRSYGSDPYANYFENDFLIFDVENKDDRIRPKDVIFGIDVSGVHKAYRESDLLEKDIEDEVSGIQIKIERREDGVVKVTNMDSGEEIVKERDFWFAWYAFHPETELYGFD